MKGANLRYRDLVEVRPCRHGKGLFALRDLPSRFVIAEFEDVVFTSSPVSPPERGHALRVGENEYWDESPPDSRWYWSNFIDHSGTPNCLFNFDRLRHTARLMLSRAVRTGEELFLKYDDYFPSNPTWS